MLPPSFNPPIVPNAADREPCALPLAVVSAYPQKKGTWNAGPGGQDGEWADPAAADQRPRRVRRGPGAQAHGSRNDLGHLGDHGPCRELPAAPAVGDRGQALTRPRGRPVRWRPAWA